MNSEALLALPLLLIGALPRGEAMKLPQPYSVDGNPVLGTYSCSDVDDLKLAKDAGMNLILGGKKHLDPATPEGQFLEENRIRVLYHLTQWIYGMPALGAPINANDTEIPLSSKKCGQLEGPGVVQIERERVRFQAHRDNKLLGCERGADGTRAASHHEGIFLFLPEACAEEIRSVKDSPNLWGYYVLDDSPGDALSALKALYQTILDVEGEEAHHPVCAGYGSPGSLCNFAPGVCDLMMIYWYPIGNSGYNRTMISHEVQWMLTAARKRVPGIPFLGVYQAFWGEGAGKDPGTRQQVREQMEDFVREGACGLVAFACRVGGTLRGWSDSEELRTAIRQVNEEIATTGALAVSPEPPAMKEGRIQPVGHWEIPRRIPGLVPAWLVVGPFDDPKDEGMRKRFPPEDNALSPRYQGKFGQISWVHRETQAGVLGLVELFHARHCVAYAACLVTSPEDQEVLLKVGSDDDCALWLDGREVYRHVGVRGLHRDQDTVAVFLRKGPQRLLAKVCNREGMWALFVRFTDKEGKPLDNLTFGHP